MSSLPIIYTTGLSSPSLGPSSVVIIMPCYILQVIFAFVPPAKYLHGWPTFVISLAVIGLLTALIGDLASIFGCLVGIPDAITAITLVALGTSMPDTFASKTAAIGEKTADSSVGNVNGSNSVNVFLGLGLPWVIASVYWAVQVRRRLNTVFSLFLLLFSFKIGQR